MQQELAHRLKSKVEELIARSERLSMENATLRKALMEDEAKLLKKNDRIIELERQLENLRLKEAFLGTSADRTQARRKIGELIKEIDACVNLLSDEK